MGKNTMEVATKPLKGAQKSVNTSNFSVRNGIHKLVKELGGGDMQIGSKAMKVVNDLACDLIMKIADTALKIGRSTTSKKVEKVSKKSGLTYETTKQVYEGITLSDGDPNKGADRIGNLKSAIALIVLDKQLRALNDQNAINCCKYAYTTNRLKVPQEMLTYGKGSKKNDMIKFPVAYIKRFVKGEFGRKIRMGAGAHALTARVQHLIGELIGMACTTANDLGDKRITTRHLQLVLSFDRALEDVFHKPGEMRPAAAIGAGMPDFEKAKGAMVVYTKKGKGGSKSMGPAAVFESESVGPDMWACVNPYDRSNATQKSRKNACKKGGFARKGFDEAYPGMQPCTESCSY
jgi:histone H3/H4